MTAIVQSNIENGKSNSPKPKNIENFNNDSINNRFQSITDADLRLSDDEDFEESSGDEGDSVNDQADSENSDGNDAEDADAEGNSGWANAFANILKQSKPKDKSYLVLSKVKKLADKKVAAETAAPVVPFEIEKGGEVKEESTDDEKPTNDELEQLALISNRKERNNKLLALRVKPSALDQDRERTFRRVATKGVVQLFNAVRSQQLDLVDKLEKAGPLDHRRDEVLNNINKRQFLDVLMGGKRAKSENVDNAVKDEDVKEEDGGEANGRPSQWSVLRDDFMTNQKLTSHWDNDDDDDDADNDGAGAGSGSDDGMDDD